MGKISVALLLILSTLQFPTSILAINPEGPPRVNIGYFKFPPLNDEIILRRVREVENNLTAWEGLFTSALEFYINNTEIENGPSDDVEEDQLRQLATDQNISSSELEVLLERARTGYNAELRDPANASTQLWFNDSRPDLSEHFLIGMAEDFDYLYYEELSMYAGIGSHVDCSPYIDQKLKKMSEWEKAGMNAATTLMALVPTFLAFGSLFVPKSSEAFATSWLVGTGAALFSLGLPVKSLSCIRRKQVIELATLDKDPLDEISDLGSREGVDSSAVAVLTDDEKKRKLEYLQTWTRPNPPENFMREFGRIRKAVDAFGERWHWWHIPAVLIAACQGIIFGIAIEPLLRAAGIPKSIYACSGVNWTGIYLFVSAATNALLRLALWQLCDHEVVNIRHLSESAKTALEAIKKPGMQTTATQLPPLYPPVISRFHTTRGHILKSIFPSYEPLPEEHPSSAITQSLKDKLDYVKSNFRNPLPMLKSGFTDTAAAPRWRPLIVLIHLSTRGRPQLRTLLTGFCEAALLLVLTFFFAAQWGGNLFITVMALALLLVFITLGRALAIFYVWLSARTWGLHSINCDEQEDILGCLRIVCSMQGVLVTVNGAHYYDGHRLDYDPEFRDWRKKYTTGAYDELVVMKDAVSTNATGKQGGVDVTTKTIADAGELV
ncbi:hypothetical protein P154DRAFT_605196 [Amniculicola lignicola CBS 123094]|uniref:Uncharacterized protein n=1 Tax=Amniculicola lignicola CBS 123094 TaxID=1392246 RepID=A0A6A5W725_9PLEO|nr:hypothetical protein P154DRAFT_605196 [Amniculicola lignicola CBS 123094]